MRTRLAALLLTTGLAPLLTSCIPASFGTPWFQFTSPAVFEIFVADDFGFALDAPAPELSSSLEIWLDGQLVDPGQYVYGGNGVQGALHDVEPGYHLLLAKLRLAGPFASFPLFAWRVIEVAGPASFQVRGSIGQVHVTHATPGAEVQLLDAGSQVVAEGETDELGSLIFREVEPGSGYRVLSAEGPAALSDPLTVLAFESSTPPQAFYDDQVLAPGFGYITTRDGTRLSVFVALPGPPEEGPYPVLVNYSGYTPSQPVGQISVGGIDPQVVALLCPDYPVLCDGPNAPEALLAGVLGYATVGVNMRGTGCSGGAYDFFEPLQLTDGYDAIEIVAAQEWAGKVGMVGISYPGISQLFVASTHPPHLAAITPLAVISGVDTTLAPGGILNDGFAVQWATNVLDGADPYGQGWEQGRVDAGDTVCEENQLLHSQKVDIIAKAYANPYYDPAIYDPLSPRTFVDQIDIPVFTSGAWQDEQTGNHFPELWNLFTGSPLVRYTGYDGAHADGFSPYVLAEWKTFLDFYVAEELRPVPETIRLVAPLLFEAVFGAGVELPPERFYGIHPDLASAKAAYEAEPAIRLLMEMGGAPGEVAGAPIPGFELFFDSWPPPDTTPQRLYLHTDGSLRDFEPGEPASSSGFRHDDAKGQETYASVRSFEQVPQEIVWSPWQPDRQAVFVSEPFANDVVMAGSASADLWIQSTASDADLEVSLSEVRPDGQEMYISSGWLRASMRALAPESTALRPVPTRLEADLQPLEPGEWALARVEVYPFAHAFRAGSRLRVEISTPGGNKGRWQFDVLQLGEGVLHAVSHSAAHPSSLLLPVIPGVVVPTPLPPCPSLRSQPCREYVPHANLLLE
ncbi:MAG: CocE/NonD family hydrolase [Deltaproteobacteria bacterium]|nr:CocE/NonD family hydrolase [Deltaproteobacteria bacterium]